MRGWWFLDDIVHDNLVPRPQEEALHFNIFVYAIEHMV